jgi:hypothetical protein
MRLVSLYSGNNQPYTPHAKFNYNIGNFALGILYVSILSHVMIIQV